MGDRAPDGGSPHAAPVEGDGAYDRIAREFDRHRERPWGFVVDWLGGLQEQGQDLKGPLVDVGCGNGRHMRAAREMAVPCLGIDLSAAMLAAARTRLGEDAGLVQGDARALPVAPGAAGAVLAVAVVHHIRSGEGRAAAFRELSRALAPGGRALVSVWALDDPGVRASARALPEPGGVGGADMLVPWSATPGGPVGRYYRAIPLAELEALARGAGLEVTWAGERGQNHVVEARAPAPGPASQPRPLRPPP